PIIAESEIKGDLELAVDKKMKPKGWIVDDAEVLGAYSVDGSDIFIPKEQTTMISAKELEERVEAANRKIRESAMDILDGKIGAHPYQTYKHDACEYCEYHGICQK
ncbi:MAG: PD-(D/E)XK nuclease family protein, partial [Clostridia bacterium]|nr:PD-(D/E)XK nuclease family protein [Clostridia bacterium]